MGWLSNHRSLCQLQIQTSAPSPPRQWMVLHDQSCQCSGTLPEAECNNCILKECIHTTCHGIPCKMLPPTVTCYTVMETTEKLNYFPEKVAALITSAQGKSSIMSSSTTRSTDLCLFSVMISLMMNQPLPTLFMCMHWVRIVFSYALFKPSKVGMNVIIFPLTRSSHDLTSLSFLQPPL